MVAFKKHNQKGEWRFILNKKIKYYTKEVLKYFNITIIGLGLIIAIVLIKYKPMYKVKISGQDVGYIENKQAFEEEIKENISTSKKENVDTIDVKDNPEYQLEFVDRTLKTNDTEIIETIKENTTVTYKYYDIAIKDEKVDSVDTIEEAEELVNEIKKNNDSEQIELSILEKYTENEDEVVTSNIDVAKKDIQEKVTKKLEEIKEQEEMEKMPEINGIKLAVLPVQGTISSRYGVSSRIRSSTHTGLDIASPNGTPIKAVQGGTVTCASYNGSYGNLVKIDHGNGIETWYAHTSKMYVSVGQVVKAGEVIAAVGSTGNSTGAHLHLEIRINGVHVNPQNYLYN